jgi:hypothetical protein
MSTVAAMAPSGRQSARGANAGKESIGAANETICVLGMPLEAGGTPGSHFRFFPPEALVVFRHAVPLLPSERSVKDMITKHQQKVKTNIEHRPNCDSWQRCFCAPTVVDSMMGAPVS